jgi:hypothetical protein
VHHRSEEATQVDVLEAVGHRLPAVYSNRFYATGGGLISYGPDFVDQFRHARWLGAIKPAAMSNIIQTRPHNRLRLSNAARFPVTSPRRKSARGTLADVSVRVCLVCVGVQSPVMLRGSGLGPIAQV